MSSVSQFGYAYIVPSICVFGIICNILNLSVLLNPRFKESPYTYLTGLATFDLLTLSFGLSLTFIRSQSIWLTASALDFKQRFILSKLETKFFLPTTNLFSPMSVIITVALTIERFFFIKFPMKASSYCLPKYARTIILVLFILATLFRIPMYLFYDSKVIANYANETAYNSANASLVQSVNSQEVVSFGEIADTCLAGNGTQLNVCQLTREIYHKKFQKFYFTVSFVIFEIVPFFILAILNVSLILMVKRSNNESKKLQKTDVLQQNNNASTTNSSHHENTTIIDDSQSMNTQLSQQQKLLSTSTLTLKHPRRSLSLTPNNKNNCTVSKRDRDQVKLTRTLIAVIFIALISEISSIITYHEVTNFLIGRHYKNYMTNGYEIQKIVSITIVFMSHSVNFFLYCAFNKRYLNVLRETYSFVFNKLDFIRRGRMSERKKMIQNRKMSAATMENSLTYNLTNGSSSATNKNALKN